MRVIFIGNGSSVKDYKAGSIIDEFDVVIRFNRGFLEGIDKYKEFVGSKTDIAIVHSGFIDNDGEHNIDSIVKKWNWIEKIKETDKLQVVIANMPDSVVTNSEYDLVANDLGISKSDFTYVGRGIRTSQILKNFKFFNKKWSIIPRTVSLNLQKIVNFGESWPSTGLCGLYINAYNYRSKFNDSVELYSYGFDGADKQYKYYHYFNHTDTRTTEFHWRPDRIDHNLISEIQCFSIIKKDYNIRNLEELIND